jgi:hypothetical protein
MSEYNHYIKIDSNNLVIYGFSDAFEQPIEGDIQLTGDFGRHYQTQLTNLRGQFLYKWENGTMVERTQTKLNAENQVPPPEPPSLQDQVIAMQQVINLLLEV